MRLYSGMSPDFVRDTTRNQIASKLEDAFFQYFRYRPSPGEVNSWRNSLRAMSQIVTYGDLNDHGVLLEYQLPLSSKRLDCLLCGRDKKGKDRAIIVELKQWDKCESSDVEKVVTSWLGGRKREVLHPSVQVRQYQLYLEDSHSAFHEGQNIVALNSCAYLHNYQIDEDDPLLAAKFAPYLKESPTFAADDADELTSFLSGRLNAGDGRVVLDRIEQSKYRLSRKLMNYVAETIGSRAPWVLLDEQLVVFEKVLAAVKSRTKNPRKQVVIIRGGPGTGKSVIAINLLADLLRLDINAHYATGSKAFTETLRDILGSRSQVMLKYFNSYGEAENNSIDVLICDESHRLRETSSSRFTPSAKRSTEPQVQELLKSAQVSVFLIDDRQVVRPNEIGSSAYIKQQAMAVGAAISEFQLDVQFRCAGSAGFVSWINNTLGVERNANVLWDGTEGFEFKIFDSPTLLESAIREKAGEGFTARVAAGFCWPWSQPRPDGSLVEDVVIGEYRRPWDAKPGNWKLAPGSPSASLWATDPNGINQVGCVYNIQGFELDYVGVIWGQDLVYRLDEQQWVGDKTKSSDNVVKRSKEQFVDLVKNTYRVLLSRGMKGCYVHFLDKETERFVRSRMEVVTRTAMAAAAEPRTDYLPSTE
jgi:DUF2075 family protein